MGTRIDHGHDGKLLLEKDFGLVSHRSHITALEEGITSTMQQCIQAWACLACCFAWLFGYGRCSVGG